MAVSDVVKVTFQAAASMIVIVFFFLLNPGKYANNNRDPFQLEDTQLFIEDRRLNIATVPPLELCLAHFALLTFTNQKNGVGGNVIGLTSSGNSCIFCPV